MRKYSFWIMFLACLVLAFSVAIVGCGQNTTSDHVSPPSTVTGINIGGSGATASANSTTVTLYPTVISTDDSSAITNLLSGNFTVTIKVSGAATSQNCTISSLTLPGAATSLPISLGLTLDRSGSMTSTDMTNMKTAAKAFIDLMSSDDELAVVSFASSVTIGVSMAATTTANKTTMKAYVDTLSDSGSTALLDSIGTAVDQSVLGANSRKAVIAMTDGGENASTTHTSTSAVISYATSKNIPVYTVGLGLTQGGADEDTLESIADGTGGIYYYAPSSEALSTLYSNISSALGNYYTMNISSPITLASGTTYIITVTIQNYGSLTGSTTFTLTI
ncbi:MAG: VWA domain-containing protein [Candidatus Saganbacteria bacterium]|nr:VWA domain-containing protein [Candidatus Saganbacteria bacterium]